MAPLRTIAGTTTGLIGPKSIAVDSMNNEIFVMNYLLASPLGQPFVSITVYQRTANGNATPLRTISGGSTGLQYANCIVIDSQRNEIYVGNKDSISVFSRTANGDIAPLRTIAGSSTGFKWIDGIAIDIARNELYVASGESISVFPRTANGNVAPLRTIAGSSTGLRFSSGYSSGLALSTH